MRAALGKVKVIKELVGSHLVFSFSVFFLFLKIKNPQLPIRLKSVANADCPFYSTQSVYAMDLT